MSFVAYHGATFGGFAEILGGIVQFCRKWMGYLKKG